MNELTEQCQNYENTLHTICELLHEYKDLDFEEMAKGPMTTVNVNHLKGAKEAYRKAFNVLNQHHVFD